MDISGVFLGVQIFTRSISTFEFEKATGPTRSQSFSRRTSKGAESTTGVAPVKVRWVGILAHRAQAIGASNERR